MTWHYRHNNEIVDRNTQKIVERKLSTFPIEGIAVGRTCPCRFYLLICYVYQHWLIFAPSCDQSNHRQMTDIFLVANHILKSLILFCIDRADIYFLFPLTIKCWHTAILTINLLKSKISVPKNLIFDKFEPWIFLSSQCYFNGSQFKYWKQMVTWTESSKDHFARITQWTRPLSLVQGVEKGRISTQSWPLNSGIRRTDYVFQQFQR